MKKKPAATKIKSKKDSSKFRGADMGRSGSINLRGSKRRPTRPDSPEIVLAKKALISSTYRNLDEPCPLCRAATVEFVRGDGEKFYWCTDIMCDYKGG